MTTTAMQRKRSAWKRAQPKPDPSDDLDWQELRDPDTDGYYEQRFIHAEEGAGIVFWAVVLALLVYGLVELFA